MVLIAIAVTPEEKELLTKEGIKQGLKLSTYIRTTMLKIVNTTETAPPKI